MSASLRRRVLPLSALALTASMLLTSCSGGGSGEPASNVETRTVVSELGEVEVPVDPQMIVALDEPAALNMLSIGIEPDVVFASWRTTAPRAIIEAAGIEVRDVVEFFPEAEEVASLEPDLIVGTMAEGMAAMIDPYVEIAPTIGALFDNATGQEIATSFGEYFERPEEAAKVVAAIDAVAEEAAEAQGGEDTSLSAVMSWAADEMPLYMDATNSLTGSIESAGFTRPQPQSEIPEGGSAFGGWSPFSAEQLPEHDADVMVITVNVQYNLEGITGLPLYPSLEAVKNDRSIVVDGDMWSGGSAFYTYWVLRDLASFAAGDYTALTVDDGERVWSEYLEASGA